MGCPASHPFAYDYYGSSDYCCPHDPAENPDSDFCIDEDDYFKGKECEHEPPCDNHPSVVPQVDGKKSQMIKLILNEILESN